MDLNAYPRLAKVKYQRASVEPGDCLYVPYLWYIDLSSAWKYSVYFFDSWLSYLILHLLILIQNKDTKLKADLNNLFTCNIKEINLFMCV